MRNQIGALNCIDSTLFTNNRDRCLVGRIAMHACQIGTTDTAPHARDRHYGPASGRKGERFGAGNLSAPISPTNNRDRKWRMSVLWFF